MSDALNTYEPDTKQKKSNSRIAVLCVLFFAGMIGLSYASVPLYQLFCQITGYGGTTQRAELASNVVLDKNMNVRFDANMGDSALGWDFKPVQREVTLKIGETTQVMYRAVNTLDRPTTGTATFNVTPQAAGAYFNKMQCFCFTETTLQPGESMDMPVVFFVDPAIVDAVETKDLSTITLSYTFYEVDEPTQVGTLTPVQDVVPQIESNGETDKSVAENRG